MKKLQDVPEIIKEFCNKIHAYNEENVDNPIFGVNVFFKHNKFTYVHDWEDNPYMNWNEGYDDANGEI